MTREKYTTQDMVELAKKKNGEFLSTEYINAHTKVKWRCDKGHEWMASPNSIRKGSWCPTCGGVKKLTIDNMHLLAQAKGGRCLSDIYINIRTKLGWECEYGHQWNASPMKIKLGTWCPECAGNKRLSIDEMQKIAKERGGRCLSDGYLNIRSKLTWECSKGHIWKVAPIGVKNGSWCPECARIARKGNIATSNQSRNENIDRAAENVQPVINAPNTLNEF